MNSTGDETPVTLGPIETGKGYTVYTRTTGSTETPQEIKNHIKKTDSEIRKITISDVEKDYEYIVLPEDIPVQADDWENAKSPDENVTSLEFAPLEPGIEYVVHKRVKGIPEKEPGEPESIDDELVTGTTNFTVKNADPEMEYIVVLKGTSSYDWTKAQHLADGVVTGDLIFTGTPLPSSAMPRRSRSRGSAKQ